MSTKTVYSRCGQWAYTMCGDSWVANVTHLPTMTTHPAGMPIARVRKLAASGHLLATVVQSSELCQACFRPFPEHRDYFFCRACLAVAPNYKEGSL